MSRVRLSAHSHQHHHARHASARTEFQESELHEGTKKTVCMIVLKCFNKTILHKNKILYDMWVPPGSPWRPGADFFDGLSCASSPMDASNCIRNSAISLPTQQFVPVFHAGTPWFLIISFAMVSQYCKGDGRISVSHRTGRLMPTEESAPEPEGADGSSCMPPSSL